jgi:hypothetical protein
MVVAAGRRCHLLDCRPQAARQLPATHHRNNLCNAWVAWVESEKKKRLGLAIYVSELIVYPRLVRYILDSGRKILGV